jgi:transposase-like protein
MQRKHYGNDFKAKVVLAALRGDKTTAELCSEFEINGNMITRWVREAKEGMTKVFAGSDREEVKDLKAKNEELYKTIGRIQVENEWLRKKLGV